ncbi:hypothetical protein [Permianibacter aggregans]|uniref:Uncharacterized protein n=1 Tax=Permianibacter aggregans TaxID=1510150 RepID=A0A4R6U9D9_9GAMM|nr:hypothetical protein [Permianibacter aggregans]QGX39677.1 hypothetical protein E2H98_08425 [Permianibacter aggregans]TDQ43208.1 hypothetical protein EV696_1316 [Permianibacter aggregans]
MNEKQIEKWQAVRAKGKQHFVLYHGVLGWGLWMFVVMTTWNHFRAADYAWQNVEPSWFSVLLNLIVWSIGGYAWGALTWTLSEQRFWRNTAHFDANI